MHRSCQPLQRYRRLLWRPRKLGKDGFGITFMVRNSWKMESGDGFACIVGSLLSGGVEYRPIGREFRRRKLGYSNQF